MIQEESHMRLHFELGGLSGARSALVTLSLGMTGTQIETCKYYNCGEVGHLSKACPKSPKERERHVGEDSLEVATEVVVVVEVEEVEATGQI
jgi:Zinc knuckle